jgi:hypothetical protein
MGRQAQVERSTRINAIEPSFRINDRLLLWSSEIVELGSLNGFIELIRLETLPATAPTIQLEGFHFSLLLLPTTPTGSPPRLEIQIPLAKNTS